MALVGERYYGKVVAVVAPDGSTLKAAAAWYKSGTTPLSHYGDAVAQIEAAGLWTGSHGCTGDATLSACEADAADWGGLGTTTADSVKRASTVSEPGDRTQWSSAIGSASFGTYP